MKKFLSLFCVLILSSPAFADLSVNDISSQKYIDNHGHSDEMSRLIDLQKSQINEVPTEYKSAQPEIYLTPVSRALRKVFMYLDCGLDDGLFMQHNIDYTTRYDDI
ncbi:MAG TPA: hypothetical protein PKI94_05045 [Candidatus Gastranaerophilaceae bacterium]|nr:hypothetical protein [Candidatus Gastranaerophilaceae bacterium]